MALQLALLVVGLFLVALAILLLLLDFLRKGGEVEAEGGAVVIVGPLPIVIASSQRAAKALIALAIALTVLSIVLFIIAGRLYPR